MDNVVPGALQRLRAADIIRMAGLAAASTGQEYCRTGAVHSTQRQGARISGMVNAPHVVDALTAEPGADHASPMAANQHHCPVEVEIHNAHSWTSTCPCRTNAPLLCVHAAALLYQWLAHPGAFVSSTPAAELSGHQRNGGEAPDAAPAPAPVAPRSTRPLHPMYTSLGQRGSEAVSDLLNILMQLGLSELRGIAREYELPINGLTKQALAEAILDTLKHAEVVRRVAATLEKPQRQLLAALTLAGGSMTDDDLRGLFERFSLGQPNQLQRMLVTLQGKALLFRTSLHNTTTQTSSLSGTLLDIGWYVPIEVCAALRVSVPITPFDVEQEGEKRVTQHHREPYSILADLFLVARALDGYQLGQDDEWHETTKLSHIPEAMPYPRMSSYLSTDGSVPVPPPADMPSTALLATLQANIPRTPAFLTFAVRLLHLSGILHKDDDNASHLRILSNAAQLLLAPTQTAVLRDLFELWLTQSSYGELFLLQEDGLRLRCRATALNMPVLRSGELDAENSEARQTIVALLAQVPSNQWISFPAFARFVYRLNPQFLQRRQRLFPVPHWWIEQNEGRPFRAVQLSDWLRAEIYYLAHLLSGPLHWWGICDVALSADGRLQAFRLTPLADWLFSGAQLPKDVAVHDYHLPSESLEVVDIDAVLVACSSRTWPIIDVLEIFTQAAGVCHNRLCYRLTPKALGDALSRGLRPTRLLELLRHIATNDTQYVGPLPELSSQLEHWIASYGRVRIYTGVALLETADAVVMRELAATTSLEEQIVQTIHPTLHVLKRTAPERLLDDLKRRGQTPLLHDEEFYGPD